MSPLTENHLTLFYHGDRTGWSAFSGPDKFFRRYTRIMTGALERLGVKGAARRGTSDLALGDMKIAGTSLYLGSRSALFHAVVNLAEEPETIARYLRMPPREPDYRAGRSHTDFVTSLARVIASLEPAAQLSPLSYYQGGEALEGFNAAWCVGLLATALLLAALAWRRFQGRDVRVGGEGGWNWPALMRLLPRR